MRFLSIISTLTMAAYVTATAIPAAIPAAEDKGLEKRCFDWGTTCYVIGGGCLTVSSFLFALQR